MNDKIRIKTNCANCGFTKLVKDLETSTIQQAGTVIYHFNCHNCGLPFDFNVWQQNGLLYQQTVGSATQENIQKFNNTKFRVSN